MTNLKVPQTAVASCDYAISAGECIYRCHRLDFAGTRFNPGIGMATRFTPLISPEGKNIPTLYAAQSFDAAVYETLFRHESSSLFRVQIDRVMEVGVSKILVRRELPLIQLFTPDLRKWNIGESELFSPCKESYEACRVLAANIWRDNPSACGIVWSSRQDSKSNAYLLFGGRCGESDLHVQQTLSANSEERAKYLSQIRNAARRAGIRIE